MSFRAQARDPAAKPLNDSARTIRLRSARLGTTRLVHRRRQSCRFPSAEATGHRAYVAIAHLLQALRDQRGAATAAAITDDSLIEVWHLFLDLHFDFATIEMLRPARVSCFPVFVRADVNQGRGAAAQFQSRVVRRNLLDALFCLGD